MGLSNQVNLYVVTYDITSDKRRNQVFNFLKGCGNHRQYSVFTCPLGPSAFVSVRSEIHDLIHHDEDQVLFFDLGPVRGEAHDRITAIGRPYVTKSSKAIII